VPHRRQPPRHAGRFEAAGVELGEVIPQRLRLGAGKRLAGTAQEFGKIGEVAAVRVERIVAGPLFRGEHVEEQVGQLLV
jgi:hypothetical protein